MNESQLAAAEDLIMAWNVEEFRWKPDEFDEANVIVIFDVPGYGQQEYRIFPDGEVDR